MSDLDLTMEGPDATTRLGNARSSAGDWEPRGAAPRLGRSDSSLSWWGESDTESGRRSEGGAESRV